MDAQPLVPEAARRGIYHLGLHEIERIILLASADDTFCQSESLATRARTARLTSQVNRFWRTVALGHPSLWVIPIRSCWHSHPSWINSVLQRSCPLLFDARIPDSAVPDAVELALRHLPRIQALEFVIPTLDVWSKVELSLRQQSAPHLSCTSIHISFQRRRNFLPKVSPNHLFCNHAPLLTELKVSNYPVDLTSKLYYSLRRLVIHNIQSICVRDLLDAIRNMKSLQELDISRPAADTGFLRRDTKFLAPDTVSLPCLETFRVSSTMCDCAELLKSLILPQSCHLDIAVRSSSLSPDRELFGIMLRLDDALRQWTCEELMGEQYVVIGSTYIMYTVQGSPYLDDPPPSIRLHVSWPATLTAPAYDYPLHPIFLIIAKSFLHCTHASDTTTVTCEKEVTAATLRPLLRKWFTAISKTQKLVLKSHHTFNIIGSLLGPRHQPESGSECTKEDVLLPILGDLQLEGVDFYADNYRQWKRLLHILYWRVRSGLPVHLIDFMHCLLPFSSQSTLFKEFGTEVRVNGNDLESDEDSDCTAHNI